MYKSHKANSRTIGTMATASSLSNTVSPSRNQMVSNQIGQAIVPIKPEIPLILTGHEMDLAKYTFGSMVPENMTVEAVIEKFPSIIGETLADFNPKITVIYRSADKPTQFGVVHMDMYQNQSERVHSTFSYLFKPTEEAKNLSEGRYYDKGTFLTRTPSVNKDELYSNTLNANIAYINCPYTVEDGIWASESFMKRATPLATGSRAVEFGKKYYPLLIYPDKNNPGGFKPFPGVGDKIRDDGVVFALRKYDPELDSLGMTKQALHTIDYKTDKVIYATAGAMVYDIDVDCSLFGDDRRTYTPVGLEYHAKRYADASATYYGKILDFYYKKIKPIRGHELTNELSALITRAMGEDLGESEARFRRSRSRDKRIFKVHRGVPLDEWKVNVKYVYEFKPTPGIKLSNLYGSKGVVCKVSPDEDMPVDKFGNRCDLVFSSKGVAARLNPGQFPEQFINAASRDIRTDMLVLMSEGKDDLAWKLYCDYIKEVSPFMYERIHTDYEDDKAEILEHIKNEPIRPVMPASSDWNCIDIFLKVAAVRFPNISEVTYKNEVGNMVTTKEKVLIGPQRIMVLEKLDHKPMAESGITRQHHGLTATENDSTKNTKPTKEKASRVLSEGDIRSGAAIMGDDIMYIAKVTNNPEIHREVCKSIYIADNPILIDATVPEHLQGYNTRPIELVKHIGKCAGFNIAHVNKKK